MKETAFGEVTGAIRYNRLDVIVFVGAFFAGLISYVALHFGLRLHQLIVSAAIVVVMFAYALLVVYVPRLRVRLDQAGDNAYYLGLLFTLVSMAFALYEFGAATAADSAQVQQTGAQQIIANFGIALASTITGIFLRVFLHQMRVDPADVESMTRIELSEASKRVRASLDSVTGDLGRFHDEVRQRSSDVLTTLHEDATKSVAGLNREHERVTKEMLETLANAQKSILEQTQELTRILGGTASEAIEAIGRLKTVEPPPLTLSRRLDKIGKVLETAGDQMERITSHLQRTSQEAAEAMELLSQVSAKLGHAAQELGASHTDVVQRITLSLERVGAVLDSFGHRMEQDRRHLAQLEEQSRRSAEESVRAQTAAVEVLVRLTELARGLTSALKRDEVTDTHGPAE